MTEAALLKTLDLFNGLTLQQLQALAAICRESTMRQGETVLDEDRASDEMYIIATGEVEVLLGVHGEPHLSSSAGPVSVGRLGAGQVFGEMALVDQGPRSATVRCVADTTRLLTLQRSDFIRLCEQDHHLGYVVMRNIAADLAFKLRTRNLARI
jgi:CRP/FNR family transcriptional regulator, cyclic AMP receptor protein